MPLATKTRLGPYEITALSGAGGMGEVYTAVDTRLERTVAIKICTGQFTERFEREARAISSLNHPHICALYDVGREGSTGYLVMEYLEGETLEARLQKGPIPIGEALQIATQIAGALDAAHRKGVIHRDLKPGNVMLTRSGAKLLDFGLAKMTESGVLATTNGSGATLSHGLTAEGTILGTFQYMSPEQLEGKEIDERSDIFAFGAMLYEIVTGRKAFAGSSHASLIASIMSTDPPLVSTIQPMASPALDRIVRRCLAKSPDDRWQSAGDLRSELEWITETGSKAGIPAPIAARRRNRERLAWIVAGSAAVLLLAGLATAYTLKKPAEAPEVRFQIQAPDKLNLYFYQIPAVSPDGERIAFTAAADYHNDDRLFVRPLNETATTEIPIPGVDPHFPFWSPDGRQIAFSSNGSLQRIDASGGPPLTICSDCKAADGGTWNRDGVILSTNRDRLLYRVSAAGGDPKPLRPLAAGETAQMWPEFLPDGNHYLYLSVNKDPGQQGIYVASLDSPDRKFLVAADANAAYLQSGQLLFMRGNVLMAQPLDLRNLALSGEPRLVADHVLTGAASGSTAPIATFAASPNGVLVWRPYVQAAQSQLQWFDRSGKRLGSVGEPADYSNPALSPDDSKLAVGIRDPQTKTRDIWIFDLLRGSRTRLTFDPADDMNSIWSPDGTQIAFTSNRSGQRNLYQKPADGSGSEKLLLGGKEGQENEEDWSRDGKYLMYNYQPSGLAHLYVLPLTGDRKPVPFINMQFRTAEGQFSPNGRWVAYVSSEAGRGEIFVQGFTLDPSQPRGKWQVSVDGGELPRWSRDGKELFYHLNDSYYAVDVKTDGPSFHAGIPKPLFSVPTVNSGVAGGSPFVVSKDGQRFLVLEKIEKTDSQALDVLVNWR